MEQAHALIEGFPPAVADRLGIGPDVRLERNPALVYARITGWGQEGPLGSAYDPRRDSGGQAAAAAYAA